MKKNNFFIFLILVNIEIQLLNTDCRGMMQAWLGECAMVDLRIEFLRKLRTRLKFNRMRECLLIWKKRKTILGIVNVEPSRLVVVSQDGNLGKYGMR